MLDTTLSTTLLLQLASHNRDHRFKRLLKSLDHGTLTSIVHGAVTERLVHHTSDTELRKRSEELFHVDDWSVDQLTAAICLGQDLFSTDQGFVFRVGISVWHEANGGTPDSAYDILNWAPLLYEELGTRIPQILEMRRFLARQGDVARDLCGALHYVLDRRDIERYPTAKLYMDCVRLHLVELPWLLGEDWGLGIEHLDKSVPWESLITRRPLPGSRLLPP